MLDPTASAPAGRPDQLEATVVIPTHNRRGLLLRTLDSVLEQQDVTVQVVVVDDGGSDGTTETLRELDLPNVSVIRNESSQGVSSARNAGLARTTTKWVAFVDDDDLWAPDKLLSQFVQLTKHGAARWSCVGALHVDASMNVRHHAPPPESGDIAAELFRRPLIPGGGSGVLVETSLAREVGGFDEQVSIVADWDFYLRLSAKSPVASVNRPLVAYYVHADSMYHNPNGMLQELIHLERKYRSETYGRPFDYDRGYWVVSLALMARRIGKPRVAVGVIATGIRRFGLASVVKEASITVRRKASTNDIPFSFGESPAGWLDRYAPPDSERLTAPSHEKDK